MYGKPRKTKTQLLQDIASDHPGAVITHAQKDPSKRNTIKYGIRNGDLIDQYLRYQDTDVIKWCANGNTVLDSGGYRTVTTKARFNEHGIRVWQDRGVWFVSTPAGPVDYFDGITIGNDGNVINPAPTNEKDRVKKITKRINKYCALVTADNIPEPSLGDCMICSMFERDGKQSDCDHLVSHLDEGYMHGSILVNAMRATGYNDMQIGVHYSMRLHETFRRALRRFLKRRFAIGS